jgi:thiamine-phosphate pyrophosphorylase
MKALPRLYAIADASFGDPVRLAEALFEGGVRLLQVRNKQEGARDVLNQVEQILALAPAGAQVIVNDRCDVALIAGATGVHVGQKDLPPTHARKILGADRIVGFSTHNLEQALEASRLPVDYIAVGPVFPTSTKENPDPVVGVDGLAAICRGVNKPVVAIGGINLENLHEVFKAGAASVAVIRDLLNTADVASRCREWVEALRQN